MIDVKEMSLQDYNSLIEHILKKKVEEKEINHYSHPIHIIQPQEVENFYICRTKIVLHNNEIIAYWFDSKDSEETGHFEYIVREVYGPSFSMGDDCMLGTHGQEVKGIPSRRVSFGNPHERLFACLTIVSKMYLDKIILVREQIKLSELGSSSSFQLPDCFTGNKDCIELDLRYPNPKALKIMEEYGICKKN